MKGDRERFSQWYFRIAVAALLLWAGSEAWSIFAGQYLQTPGYRVQSQLRPVEDALLRYYADHLVFPPADADNEQGSKDKPGNWAYELILSNYLSSSGEGLDMMYYTVSPDRKQFRLEIAAGAQRFRSALSTLPSPYPLP